MSAADPRRATGRRWLLLGLLAGLGLCAAAGWYVWRNRFPAPPDVPSINLDGADPEVAEAVANARAAVEKKPRSAGAWGELALVLHAHAFHHEAARAYAAAAALDPDNPDWPYLHGVILHEGDADPEAALPYLRKAAELSSALPARVRLGEVLLELGRLEQAESEFKLALASAPGDVRARLGLAEVAAARQDHQAALRYLEAVGESPHARQRACAQRASLYGLLGDQAAARREQRRMAQLERDQPWPDEARERMQARRVGLDARLSRASALAGRGRVSDALELLDSTVERYPNSDRAWAQLGEVLVAARDNRRAERALRKSVELAPQKAENWLVLAGFLMSQRRSEDAEKAFRKAIDLTPANVIAHLGLGDSLRAQGNLDGAADAYRSALRHRPHADEVRQRLAELGREP